MPAVKSLLPRGTERRQRPSVWKWVSTGHSNRSKRRLPMRLKLFCAVTIFATAPIVAFAQKDDPENQAPKPTVEDAQKVVQTISSDKNKLQAYCDLGKLQEQMEKAEEKNDTKAIDALVAKAETLEQQVGPDYTRIMDGLDQLEPNSAEGQKFIAVFNTLHDKCK
jgi:hypothetical protein